jgi:hypothetical protein
MSVTVTHSTTTTDSAPIIYRTNFAVSSVALGLANSILVTQTEGAPLPVLRTSKIYSVGAPNAGPVLDIAYTSGTTYTPTLTYPVNSVAVSTGGGTTPLPTVMVRPAFPASLPLSGTNTLTYTFNSSAAVGTIAPTFDTNTGIGVNVNGLRTGRIKSFSSGNVFNYSFDPNAVNIVFTFDVVAGGTFMSINVVSLLTGSLTPVNNPVAGWNTPGFTNANALLSLVISSMTVTYEPTSLTDVLMTITLPTGGFQWSSILPSAQGPFTYGTDFQAFVLLSLPGSRTISTSFYMGALLDSVTVTNPASSIAVTSGATTVIVPSVPSTSPAVVTVEPFCIHPDSMVHTSKGLVRLGNLKSGQNIELIDLDGNLVPMLFNAKFSGSSKFVMYPADSIGSNQPSEDLYITEGHPIYVNGRECVSKYMINDKIKLVEKPTDETYALVTAERTFTLINNIPVCTWALADLQEIGKQKGLYYKLI